MENVETIVAENTERDAVVATPPKADLSKLSDEPWLQANVNTFDQPKPEAKIDAVVEEKLKADEAATADLSIEKPEADVVIPESEVVETDAPLQIEDAELSLENNEAPEDSWFALAKSQGLEIKEDTVEAFIEAKTQPLIDQISAMDNKKMEDYFGNLDPKTRMEIELQNAGYSLEQIKAPLDNIAKYRAMNPVELYREDLTLKIEALRELSDDDRSFIDKEVERKVESGDIDHEHKRLMLMLDESENSILQEQQQIVDKFKVNNEKSLADKRNNEVESISKALNEVQSFMGSTIAPESLNAMAKKYGEGKYDQILKDPKFIANAIKYHELGQKAYDAAIAKSEAKGKLEYSKTFHNTPPIDKTSGGMNTTPQEQLTGLAKLRNEPGLKV